MRVALAHRGPDGHGEHRTGGVGLAHARLSIIDVAGAPSRWPTRMTPSGSRSTGEIYNYRELMDRLAAGGHHFRTRSDTEVMVHLYEDRGPEFVTELNGMFAFALHDIRRRRVVSPGIISASSRCSMPSATALSSLVRRSRRS